MTDYRKALPKDYQITSEYKVIREIGRGGSSIIYLCEYNDGLNKPTFVLVKEIFPNEGNDDAEIGRGEDGRIIPGDSEEFFKFIKELTLKEIKTAHDIRHNANKSLQPYTFDSWKMIDEPDKINNTTYIVLGTEQGNMLSEIIAENEKAFKSGNPYIPHYRNLYDICNYVIMMLKALKAVHSKGYLHLDIAPDNLHVSALSGMHDERIIRLIDYNSAIKLSENSEASVSFKPGYSAPELINLSKYNMSSEETTPKLSYETDLFSVAAIMYRMLMSAVYDKNEFACRKVSDKNKFCKNVCNLAINKTNEFFTKNLNLDISRRCKDIDKMLTEVMAIAELAKPTNIYLLDGSNNLRYPAFCVQRDDELQEIHNKLQKNKHVFLQAIGGNGKTALSQMYLLKHKDEYDSIQIVEYSGNLESTVMSIKFGNYENEKKANGEIDVRATFLRKIKFLSEKCSERNLIIIENFNTDEDKDLSALLGVKCRIIFNTRNKGTEIRDDYLYLKILPLESYITFFLNIYEAKKAFAGDIEKVKELIEITGRHFLLIKLIALLIRDQDKPLDVVIEALSKSMPLDKGKVTRDELDYGKTKTVEQHLQAVFDLSKITDEQLLLMKKMSLMPYFGVSTKLFAKWAELDVYDDLNDLSSAGWLENNAGIVSMHPVISNLVYHGVDCNNDCLQSFIENVAGYCDLGGCKSYQERALLFEFAKTVAGRIVGDTLACGRFFNEVGSCYNDEGNYDKALEYYFTALDIRERVLGEDNPDTATSYNNIGAVYKSKGEYDNALECYFKDLDICERVLGKDNPSTATSYNNIGGVYYSKGEYDKTLEYNFKALDIKERVLGKDNPSTAMSYNNIGSVYCSKGEYDKALEYYSIALDIWERVLGKNHPNTATSYNNIGAVYDNKGEYDRALEYYFKALDFRKHVLGKEHPDIAVSYNNIGLAYDSKGEYDNALKYCFKALGIWERVLGKEHPNTATSYNNIGMVYKSKGEYDKALEYYFKALDIRERVLGKDNPNTATSYNNIGGVYKSEGEYDKALKYYFKDLDICECVLGKDNPSTATSYNNIGGVYYSKGECEKALEYYFKALDIRERVLGKDNPSTAISYNNIGSIYEGKSEYDKALEFHFKALDIKERVLGKDNPSTAMSYNNIGMVYHNKGEYDKALEYYFKDLDIKERVLGKDNPSTATSYGNIGAVYDSKGEYDKALEFRLKALDVEERVLGKDNPDTATSYNNIGFVYKSKGDFKKAIEFFFKALDIYSSLNNIKQTNKLHNKISECYNQMGDSVNADKYKKLANKEQ